MTLAAFTAVIVGIWAIAALVEYAELCYFWQLKEYRLDRFRDFLRTKEGKKMWWRTPLYWRVPLLFFLLVLPLNYDWARYAAFAVASLDALWFLSRLVLRRLPRPVITVKALGVMGLSLLVEAILGYFTREWAFMVAVAMSRVVLMGVMVALMNVPTSLAKKVFLLLATRKLQRFEGLLVIGITGSYGKSSTKEFLDTILSRKFSVVRTPKNINTEIGVAQFILKTSFEGKDIFLVEMDAYRLGENTTMCQMVKPKIGILTAINEQHLSLTGSIENTQMANFELLRALPVDGLAITNTDNALCREPLPTLTCTIQTFGTESTFSPTCLIKEAEPTPKGMKVSFALLGEEVSGITPIVGTHHSYNIAPCLLIARHLGIPHTDLVTALETLHLPVHGMKIRSYGRTTVIDDSYNSNPDGFAAALDVLSRFGGERRRIVMTRGMLELGNKTEELHRRIGEEIAFMADELVIIKPDFAEFLIKGVGEKYKTNIRQLFEPAELVAYLRTMKETDAVILLENRMPEAVYRELASTEER